MAAKDLMLPNGWAIGFSQDVIVEALERGERSDMALNVSFADSAAEGAEMLRTDFYGLMDDWKGSEQDRLLIAAFMRNF